MSEAVLIGCRLPHGLQLTQAPDDAGRTPPRIPINGLNKAAYPGAPYATTLVDAEAWAKWKLLNADFPALKSKAIFEISKAAPKEIEAAAKDAAAQPTGLEPLAQNAGGVKPDDKTDGE